MDGIVNLIRENTLVIGLALVVVVVFLFLTCETLRQQLKKGGVILLVILGLGVGYYLLTGKSLTDIPGDVNRYFSDPQLRDEASHRYYKDPEEGFEGELELK